MTYKQLFELEKKGAIKIINGDNEANETNENQLKLIIEGKTYIIEIYNNIKFKYYLLKELYTIEKTHGLITILLIVIIVLLVIAIIF